MNTFTVNTARTNLHHLIDEVASSHKLIHITGKRVNAVLISEEDWSIMQETLYLLSIPEMRESIKKGLKTSIKKCKKELSW